MRMASCYAWTVKDHVSYAKVAHAICSCDFGAEVAGGHSSKHTPVFELGQVVEGGSHVPRFGDLIVRRPTAAVALLPQSAVLFTAGAVAGALGRPSFLPPSGRLPFCKDTVEPLNLTGFTPCRAERR